MFNFQNAEIQEEKFVRRSEKKREQNWNFKFRPYLSNVGRNVAKKEGKEFEPNLTHEFKFSNSLMEELDIQNNAIAILLDKNKKGIIENVALVVTPEGHSKANTFISKASKKLPQFTHHFLQLRLAEAGVIKITDNKENDLLSVNQYLDLEYVTDVVDIIPEEEGFMEEVEQGQGMAIYQIVKASVKKNTDILAEVEEEVEEEFEEEEV